MGHYLVWRECPLLLGSCLWDEEDHEVLPPTSSLYQVSLIIKIQLS